MLSAQATAGPPRCREGGGWWGDIGATGQPAGPCGGEGGHF